MTTVDDLLAAAQERTGLVRLDADTWRPGLGVVVDDLEDPRITEAGRDRALGRAVDCLANRLRVTAYVAEHPEVLEERVERPLFILGMPRTGTTVASYLLDQDPARRSLLKWEAVDSVPPATTATLRTDARCLRMREEDAAVLLILRSSGTVLPHWEDADGPTECMFLHQQDFKGLMWDALTPTDRYATWLLEQPDVVSAYEYEKRVLQVLQSRAPGAWSLKMPSHALHLESLLQVFPDAQLVWAHRDPFTATASMCNLLKMPAALLFGADDVPHELIGRNAARQMREHVERPMAVRERIGDDRFFDLRYDALIDDPIGQMKAIYDWAGDTLTPDVEQRMTAWLADNPQGRHGTSRYTLEEYGLTRAELEPVFERYVASYDVTLDPAP